MQVVSFFALAGIAALAVLTIAPRHGDRAPLAERLCRRLLHLAAWLEDVATAWDSAILRYRLERRIPTGDLECTVDRAQREAREVAA